MSKTLNTKRSQFISIGTAEGILSPDLQTPEAAHYENG